MTKSANSDNVLLYFADPMCSWCWGFSPVIDRIKQNFGKELKIALVLGGLRPGTTDPMDNISREEILHHWRQVHDRTGQLFCFEDAMPEGFVYDTEPPSRGVVTMGELNPEAVLSYLKSVQSAFYTEQKNVTKVEILAKLASQFDVGEEQFQKLFETEEIITKTLAHFHRARQFGVRGFPTVVLQNPAGYTLLTHGYQSYEVLAPQITAWLN